MWRAVPCLHVLACSTEQHPALRLGFRVQCGSKYMQALRHNIVSHNTAHHVHCLLRCFECSHFGSFLRMLMQAQYDEVLQEKSTLVLQLQDAQKAMLDATGELRALQQRALAGSVTTVSRLGLVPYG